jgi:hypothetical protein
MAMAISSAASTLLPVLLGCVAAALVTGCEKRLSDQNIDQANKLQQSAQQRKSRWPGVSEGMTEKEVESILGEPANRRPGKTVEVNQPVQMATVTYVYEQDGQMIELHFLDGKLQGKIPKFGETAEATAPLKMNKGENGLSGGASGSSKDKPMLSREFRGALADKIKEEEAEVKAAAKGGEKAPAKDDEKKEKP